MSVELITAFTITVLTFAFVPGPAILYVVARTMAGGRTAGFASMFGMHLGGYVHVISATAGLAVLLQAVPVAYVALKFVGAAYLVWLGIGMIRSRFDPATAKLPQINGPATFRQSFLVEATNPKAALFFLALLPQFTVADAALSIAWQMLWLGVLANIVFSLADVFYILAVDWVRNGVLKRPGVGTWLNRLGGGLLIGLGVQLGLSKV